MKISLIYVNFSYKKAIATWFPELFSYLLFLINIQLEIIPTPKGHILKWYIALLFKNTRGFQIS